MTRVQGLSVIASANDFWTADHRDLPHPVRMTFQVTFYDPHWANLWIEEEGGPAYLRVGEARPALRAGQRVFVQGTIVPNEGLSADRVKISVLEEKHAGPGERVVGRVGELASLDRHRVEVEGFVDTVQMVDAHHYRLNMIVESRPVVGWVLLEDGQQPGAWAHSYVNVTGAYSSRVDPSGTVPEIEIWIPGPENVRFLRDIGVAPEFTLPITAISHLFEARLGETVHVRGRVQNQQPGAELIIRDESGQVTLDTLQEELFAPGTEVEAVGLAAVLRNSCSLRYALVRRATQSVTWKAPRRGEPLKLIDEVRSLSPEQAGEGRPVSVLGVVTWAQPDLPYLYLQDVSGGIRVSYDQGAFHAPTIGQSVRVDGVSFDYGVARGVRATSLVQIASMRMPQQQPVSCEQALTGSVEAQWVEMFGYLRRSEVRDGRTHLAISTPTGNFSAVIQTPEDLSASIDALVRIRGVCETVLDGGQRITGFRLWVPYLHNVLVYEPAPANPFDVPSRSVAGIRQISLTTALVRARTDGVVTLYRPGQYLFLQKGDAGLMVETRSREPLAAGDKVEVVGMVGRVGGRVLLRDAVFRRVAPGAPPAPVTVKDPAIASEPLDGRLVAARGVVISQLSQPNRSRLTLQSGEAIFETWLEHPAPEPSMPEYAIGTGLEVTGVYRVAVDDARQVRGFQLYLRTPADIRVYQKPQLWTTQRAVTAASLLGGCALLGFAWAASLRRRVRRQTDQLRSQVHKEVVMEERHRGIVENASDFIFTTDLDGRLTSFNPAGERITGFTRAEALRMNIRELLMPESEKEPWLRPELSPEAEGTVTFQSRLRTRDGRVIWIETSSRLIRDEGKTVGVLGIVRDISERKQIEEELKRARDAAEANTRAKSEFLANMSHEIRTPMNAVIGMSNLLLDTRLDERQRDFAETIRNGAEALLTVLNDILDFSKMEAGRLQIETVDFDLRETIDGTVELLAARAAAKSLELTAFVPNSLPCALRGDPSRLRQVLLNLLGNAVKFTQTGEVILQVSVDSEAEATVQFRFEIIDTGVGIPAEEQARLFRPFTQADSSTTRRFGGTGLGLAISKQIVDLMDGRCGVRSREGEGSTFWFTAKFARQPVAENSGPLDPAIPRLDGLKALVVDDSSTCCQLVEHYTGAWGMRTTDANSGAEALQLLRGPRGEEFALAIVDTHMPEMDGLALAREIRRDPRLAKLRFVFLNSLDRALLPAELQELGDAAALLKPIRRSELLSALVRVLPEPVNGSESAPGPEARGVTATPRSTFGVGGTAISVPPVSLRVLLAEDNTVNQRVALLQLQKLGHRASAVSNGQEVLETLERGEFDVILMDCHMPEMDGFEATRRIRQHKTHGRMRIIALTANAMQGDREKCLEAGMNDYLSKPVRVPELQAALARCYPSVE